MSRKNFKFVLAGMVMLTAVACSDKKESTRLKDYPVFLKEGHRGTRGLMPENTIPAMEKGVEVGANVVEMDVYTTKDGKVLVAHDPYANIQHTLREDSSEISKDSAKNYVWHQMNYDDIAKLDVGSKYYAAFPEQQKMKVHMPLLADLIDSVEAFCAAHKLAPPIYNIELKNSPQYDSLGYNASPADLVHAVMDVVKTRSIGHRFYLQSFDIRPLQVIHQEYPEVVIGFLTSDKKKTAADNLKELGFTPDLYSPSFNLVTPELVKTCQELGMKLVPWTVNSDEDIKRMVDMGVNGIITDYPNKLKDIK